QPEEAACNWESSRLHPSLRRLSVCAIRVNPMSKLLGMKRKNLRSGHAPKAPVRPPPDPARRIARKSRTALNIPPILFEGDQPAEPTLAGAGQKFAVGPAGPGPQEGREKAQEAQKGELPEGYGTRKVLLLAREPHWLYAHWDLTREQQRRYNARSIHR